MTDRRAALLVALTISVLVAAACGYAWGFTVDDALITGRVAHHLRTGAGYRFNVEGPIVDAVTPLGFAYILMPFAKDGALAAVDAARLLGAASWTLAAGALAYAVVRKGTRRMPLPLVFLALSAPLIAWAVAGMETGLVTVLATIAIARGPTGALGAGLAAGLRPELIPWAVTLAVGTSVAEREGPSRGAGAAALSLGPALIAAFARAWAFGSPAPLAVHAKPSDTAHGLFYAGVVVLWTGVPLLLAAGPAWRRVGARERVAAVAGAVHVLALVGAGGDWMPLGRLFVPVLPSLIWAACALDAVSAPVVRWLRFAVAAAPVAVLWIQVMPEARGVTAARRQLAARLASSLRPGDTVAALDVGWVGAATPGPVVDLAGVTDPRVAVLPGGHTSKRLPEGFIDRRDVDVLVLRLAGKDLGRPWWRTSFATEVESWAARIAAERPIGRVELLAPLDRGTPRYAMIRLNDG